MAHGQSESLARWLPERRRRRKPRHARRPRGLPPHRAIHDRPHEIATRQAFGHWECDLVMFRREHGSANVTSLVERRTRYALLFKNNDRRSKPLMDRPIDVFSPLLAAARQSMTFDRGLEFISWRELATGMGTDA